MVFERQKLTKCEKLILKLIASTGGCDYSFSEMSQHLGISRQTAYLCLNSLVEDKYIEKSYFFIGRVKRCKYSVTNFFSNKGSKFFTSDKKDDGKNFTSEKNKDGKNFTSKGNKDGKNFTMQSESEETGNKGIGKGWAKVLGHKKESSRKTRLTLKLIDLDRYNINNIYNISNQSNNTMGLSACQGVKSIFSKKIDKILGEVVMADSANVGKGSIIRTFKTIVEKISREKNENAQIVNKFFGESEEQDLHSVAWGVIGAVARRIADKTKAKVRNLYAYMRTAIVKAVQDFLASKVDESEVKTLMYEAVQQINKSNKKKIDTSCLARNFEQRDYSEEYLESFYANSDAAPGSPATSATVKSKVDTSRLSRNFNQREYSEGYWESFYKNNDTSYSPATSTPAKDIVMDQVRAMRDSFGKSKRIRPLSCVDLW